MKISIITTLTAFALGVCSIAHAEVVDTVSTKPSFNLEYIAEMQTDFENAKLVNFLHLTADVPLSKHFALNLGTISVASTSEDYLGNDIQVFSNVESYNIPLALTVAGVTWQISDSHSLFGGVRRIDEDYFCSDALSLFTNSSCGAFPTISANHSIAVYPFAALGVHYAYDKDNVRIQGSLYNGVGSDEFTGRYNVFRFCPKSDGVFGMAQVEYRHGGSKYFLGGSAHYGETWYGDDRKIRPTLWAYAEHQLSAPLTLIAGYGHSFDGESLCKNFAGVGAIYALGNVNLGVFSDYTRIVGVDEFATEFTAEIPCGKHVSLRPTLHLITTDAETDCLGTLRLHVTL